MPRNKKKTVVNLSPAMVETINQEHVTFTSDIPELQHEVDMYNQTLDYTEEHQETDDELLGRMAYEEIGRAKMRQLLGVSKTEPENEGDIPMMSEDITTPITFEDFASDITTTLDDTAKLQELYTAATGESDKDAGFTKEEIENAEEKSLQNAAKLLGTTVEELKKQAIKTAREKKITNKAKKPEIKFVYPSPDQLDKDGCMMVPLSSLVTLDETGIPNASKAVRPIDKAHAFDLTVAYEDGEPVPPPIIIRVDTGKGIVNGLVSGGHRRYAMIDALRNRLSTTHPETGVRIEGSSEALLKLIHETAFKVRPIVEPMTPFDVLELAFRDNRNNALPMAEGTKKEYAILLYDHGVETGQTMFQGKKFSLRVICRYAGLKDHSSVSRALKERADKIKKTVEAVATKEDASIIAESAEAQDIERDNKKYKASKVALFKSIEYLCGISTDVSLLTTELQEYCTESTHANIGTMGLVLRNMVANMPSPK